MKQLILHVLLLDKRPLNPFSLMSHFHTPRKRQKIFGSLKFSGSIEIEHWLKCIKVIDYFVECV